MIPLFSYNIKSFTLSSFISPEMEFTFTLSMHYISGEMELVKLDLIVYNTLTLI
jgi:hypothetical protein